MLTGTSALGNHFCHCSEKLLRAVTMFITKFLSTPFELQSVINSPTVCDVFLNKSVRHHPITQRPYTLSDINVLGNIYASTSEIQSTRTASEKARCLNDVFSLKSLSRVDKLLLSNWLQQTSQIILGC